MFKIIYNNLVIDVVKKPKYMRYLSKSGRLVVSDKTSSHCVMGSNDKDVYLLQGVTRPEGKDWKEVALKQITENEYESLFQSLASNQSICADKNELKLVRSEKIQELSLACRDAIVNGVSVLFSDNNFHTFELSVEDQLNLMAIESEIKNGAKYILYHEKNKVCELYHADDIQTLITTAQKHKTYHTTYFNILKNYISKLYDIDMIRNIQYGMDLPEEYNNKLIELLN